MKRGASIENRMRPYPTENGSPVSPFALGFLETTEGLRNNHHGEFSRRQFGADIILQTMRDLDIHQWVMPRDIHASLHRRFSPPLLPTHRQALDAISQQQDVGGLLKYGSAAEPIYYPITDQLLINLKTVYNQGEL